MLCYFAMTLFSHLQISNPILYNQCHVPFALVLFSPVPSQNGKVLNPKNQAPIEHKFEKGEGHTLEVNPQR